MGLGVELLLEEYDLARIPCWERYLPLCRSKHLRQCFPGGRIFRWCHLRFRKGENGV